ncbi:conjugal transfer protein TraG N-terminal domain-containing protein [Proteus vulgaris]|uniref:conjugal transfer protein TraG N-terminal domain-containing protein n=1 Tax=Proteus vulgaris TaxID=585 RepID=UPI001FFFF6CF|nr:conjugal transfer protein TraG N-terminal domain-containing protein [Proteus vulgaris]UPK80653.1 conjugal transfer protein TraG N-terminal domain-containing protein [Proteus vulgaris]
MTTESYLELVLLFMAWLINNSLWMLITTTGLFALPLAIKIAGIWLKAREEGEDEGNKGILVLSRMENTLYVAFVVMIFCAVPLWEINVSTLHFDRTRSTQCSINVPKPADSGYGALIAELNGQTAKVPLWWYLVHSLSKGVTHATIATIPCSNDFRLLRFEVQNTQLIDPILRQEVQEFATQCYAKAYYKLKNLHSGLSPQIMKGANWIGSDYFLNTIGYYDYYTATFPQQAWSYNENRDSGYANVSRGGYPTCKAWWNATTEGLKKRLLTHFEPRTINMMKAKSPDNWEEGLLRWLVSPQSIHLASSGNTYMMGNQQGQSTSIDTGIKQAISSLGTFLAQTTQLPAFDALRQGLPMIHAILLMALIIIIPLILLLGVYEPKIIITLTFVMFAWLFVPFWWALASWLDDKLIELLYASYKGYRGDFNIWLASTGSDSWIMNLVLGAMYVVLPLFWFGAVSWSGVNLGFAVSSAISSGSKGIQQAGAQGGSAMLNVVKKGIMKK